MSDPIAAWLQQLDAICEAQGFETAEQAEAWLQEMSHGHSIEEFFDQHSPSTSHLLALLAAAESEQTPETALPLYQRAVCVGERFFAHAILQPHTDAAAAQEKSPSLTLYTAALGGLAACQEWTMQAEAAALTYRKMIHADPLDHAGAFEKLFCLLITQGHLAEARATLATSPRSNSFTLYNEALIAILEAADIAAVRQFQDPDPEQSAAEAASHQHATHALDRALRANRYLPHLLTHPRSMQLDATGETSPGSPAEALTIAQTSAHLWLGDSSALEWIIRQAPRFPLSHGGHQSEWQQLLDALGGDVSHSERLAYLQAIQEQTS